MVNGLMHIEKICVPKSVVIVGMHRWRRGFRTRVSSFQGKGAKYEATGKSDKMTAE